MTNIVLSNLVAGIEPSPTEETSFLANTLKRQGVDVISFAQGEPDFDTPNYIKKAAIKAINEGFTKYTDVGGIIELKEAVVEKLKRQNNFEYDISGVIIGNGGKQLLYEAFATLCNPGDEVLIPTPCYVSYADQIRLTGARARSSCQPQKKTSSFLAWKMSKNYGILRLKYLSLIHPVTQPEQFSHKKRPEG